MVSNTFYEATVNQYETKTNRIKQKKISDQSFMNIEVKIFNRILPRNSVIYKKNIILPPSGLHTANRGLFQYLEINPCNSLY